MCLAYVSVGCYIGLNARISVRRQPIACCPGGPAKPLQYLKGLKNLKSKSAVIILLAAAVLAGVSCKNEPDIFPVVKQHILPHKRTVQLDSEITVNDIPDGTKTLQLWIPFPVRGQFQNCIRPMIEHPGSYRPLIYTEKRYGTRWIFVSAEQPLPKSLKFSFSQVIERVEINHRSMTVGPIEPAEAVATRFAGDLTQEEGVNTEALTDLVVGILQPKPTAPVEGESMNLEEAVETPPTGFARARAIYDYVVDTLEAADAPTEDGTTTVPTGPSGTVAEVLDSRKGNYIDYARVTVALLRTAGIPARIESGVKLGEDRAPDSVEAPGRTAWVRFYVNGFGWTACDPHHADIEPDLRDYMFAGVCANRVQFSAGPLPALVPEPKAGVPIVFDRAIAEADEKPIDVRMTVSFRDYSVGATP